MSRSALILNDTSAAYHWGCYGTSSEIWHQLEGRGYTVSTLSVVDVQNIKSPPRKSDHFTAETFHRVFLADNPEIAAAMEAADVIAVNGEGTLHGLGQAAFNLLFLILLAKRTIQKPVHLINTSVFPEDDGTMSPEVAAFYGSVLNKVDRLVVREPFSADLMTGTGIPAIQGFDCLPLFLKRQEISVVESVDGPIVVGGGLGLTPAAFRTLIELMAARYPDKEIHYTTGAPRHPASDDARLIDACESLERFDHRVVDSFEAWADVINKAACLVSGRFHHSIAAAFLETPMVTFKAGTPKMDGLCQALKVQPPLALTDQLALDAALARVIQCVEERPIVDADVRESCLTAAVANFDSL